MEGNRASSPTRPTLPSESRPTRRYRIKLVFGALFFALGGVGSIWMTAAGGIARKEGDDAAIVVIYAFALLFLFMAGVLVNAIGQRVVVDEEGLFERRFVRTRRTRWSDVGVIELGARSVAQERRERMGHAVGGVVGGLVAVATASNGGGNPFDDEVLRPQFLPSATLRDATGRRLTSFSSSLPWEFYGLLVSEARARNVEIRTAGG